MFFNWNFEIKFGDNQRTGSSVNIYFSHILQKSTGLQLSSVWECVVCGDSPNPSSANPLSFHKPSPIAALIKRRAQRAHTLSADTYAIFCE